jgi:hypothetical protein
LLLHWQEHCQHVFHRVVPSRRLNAPKTELLQQNSSKHQMKRLFGLGGDKAPAKSLDEVSETMDARSAHVDTKVKAIDHELLDLKKQMAVTKGPGLQRLKQRAMMLLKQRKVLDTQ